MQNTITIDSVTIATATTVLGINAYHQQLMLNLGMNGSNFPATSWWISTEHTTRLSADFSCLCTINYTLNGVSGQKFATLHIDQQGYLAFRGVGIL